MVLGYCLRVAHICSIEVFNGINKLVFKVFLPTMLFWSVYTSDFEASFQPRLLLLAVALVTASWGVVSLILWKAVPDPARRGVMIQGMCRANYVIFGIPIATALFGAESIGVTAVLIAVIVPLFNGYSVAVLEVNGGGSVNMRGLILAIFTNPLIDATILALFAVFSGVRLPGVAEVAIKDVGGIATPLALIVIGGTFRFSRVGKNAHALFATVLVRLVAMPAAFIGIGVITGYHGVELGALLAMSASPTAVSSYPMAREIGCDDELAGQMVVVSTSLSVVTMFLWIFGLNLAGLL